MHRGMWDLPGPGLKPVSPSLAGGFLTTAAPGKSFKTIFETTVTRFKCLITGYLDKAERNTKVMYMHSKYILLNVDNNDFIWNFSP